MPADIDAVPGSDPDPAEVDPKNRQLFPPFFPPPGYYYYGPAYYYGYDYYYDEANKRNVSVKKIKKRPPRPKSTPLPNALSVKSNASAVPDMGGMDEQQRLTTAAPSVVVSD